MTIIHRPAALVRQGNLNLFATSMRAEDLLLPGFYTIERFDPDQPDSSGYQRLLNKGRAKRLSDYLVEGQKTRDAFLPTSVFLATDKDLAFDASRNMLTIDTAVVGPFSVVDGQHRLEGLRLAVEKDPDLRTFEVPVNIATNLPAIAQMCHFLIVNTTQKSVDKAVEQRIFARLTEAAEFEDVPNLPRWIRRIVESGDDEQALRIVDYLNSTDGSPWLGKIEMANQDLKSATINQKTFVKLVKKYVLTANNPISVRQAEQQERILLNYWRAIANLLDIGRPTVLFKSIGVELFLRFSAPVLNRLTNVGSFRVPTFENLLKSTFEHLDGDHAGAGHPDWWLSGSGPAGGLNAAAIGRIVQEMSRAMHKAEIGPVEL